MRKLPINKGAWIRLALLGLALINQALIMAGYSPIPLDDTTLEQFISLGFTVAAALIAGWKDNDVTKKARLRKQLGEKEIEKLEK